MKPGSTTTSRKPRKRGRNDAIPLHQNRKIPYTTICGKGYADSLLDKGGVLLEHYKPRWNTVTNTTYEDHLRNNLHPAIKSKRRGRLNRCFAPTSKCSVPYCPFNCCNNPRLSFECLSHSPYSPDLAPVTFISLDSSIRRWEESLSGPTKK